MKSHTINPSSSQYENLQRLLKDYSIEIQYRREHNQIPSGGMNSGPVNVPPSLKEIDKAFEKNNVHKITKMVLRVSTIVHNWIDLHKALFILDEALKTPLKDSVYKHGFFNRNKIITCGNKLSKDRDFVLASINKATLKEEARHRFARI